MVAKLPATIDAGNLASMVENEPNKAEWLDFRDRCAQRIDQLGVKMEDQLSRIDAQFDEKIGNCISLLHQMLRDRGLPIPAKHSSSRSQLKTVSPSSSSEAIVVFPQSRIQDPLRSVASSSLANLESASTPVLQLSSSIKSPPLDSSEENQSTTSPTVGKEFQSTEPDLKRPTINGESSICQIVENLEFKAFRHNFNSAEIRNRDDELWIVEALAKGGKRDEYQLENKEFENSVSGAHKVFDKMPALFPALELISKDTICVPAKTELFKEVDWMNFIFDPGGESHTSKSIDCDKLVFESEQYGECEGSFGGLLIGRLKRNEMIAEGCKFRILQWDPGGKKEGTKRAKIDEPLVIAICYQGRKEECEFTAEFVGLLQSSPSKIVVFDPGGGCEGRKCLLMEEFIHLLEVPIHWDPGG